MRGRFTRTALVRMLLAGAIGCALTAAPAPAVAEASAGVDFTGIVALSGCSGALVRPAPAADTDPALVLANGHCLETGMPAPGQVIVGQPSARTFDILDAGGHQTLGTLTATKVAYATMTDTDIALYQVNASYADIGSAYHSRALDLATAHPGAGATMTMPSGFWKQQWHCGIASFVNALKEDRWTWRDSIKYDPACHTTHGTSGSPIVDDSTHQVVGVNNTANDDGLRCTLNNPCEVDRNGAVTVHWHQSYGEETVAINGCVGAGNGIDLGRPGCALPKPGPHGGPGGA